MTLLNETMVETPRPRWPPYEKENRNTEGPGDQRRQVRQPATRCLRRAWVPCPFDHQLKRRPILFKLSIKVQCYKMYLRCTGK